MSRLVKSHNYVKHSSLSSALRWTAARLFRRSLLLLFRHAALLCFAPIPLPSAASRLNSSSCNRRRCYELPAIRSSPSSTSSASAGLQAHGPPPTHPPPWRASRLPRSSPTFAGSAVAGCISSPWASSSFTSRITTSVSRAPVSACCPANQPERHVYASGCT